MKADVSSSGPPLVELKGISKRYGDLLANDGIDLSIEPGEIHALLGENGAGKSTLVKILYGVIEPSAGEIRWEGRPVSIALAGRGAGSRPRHGVPALLALRRADGGREHRRRALRTSGTSPTVRSKLGEISRTYGLALDADRAVWTLSAGERQRIEIVRCLLQNPRLLILDEPTSVLTPQEAEHLFTTLDRLSAEGCSILYISHKLEEVRRLCRRATILRAGRVVATIDPRAQQRPRDRRPHGRQRGRRGPHRCAAPPGRRDAAGSRALSMPPAGPARPGAARHQPRGQGRRGRRHRRRCRQRPERAFRRALRRAPGGSGRTPSSSRARPCGTVGHRCAAPARRGLRAGGAPRPRGRADPSPEREHPDLPCGRRRSAARASSCSTRPSGSPARSSRASTCARRKATRRRASSPAATCRNSSSAARSSASRSCSSSTSRPGASMRARRA